MDGEKRAETLARELVASLAARRRELGLTQSEVALRAGLQQAAVARFEAGRLIPHLDTVMNIASALGVRVGLVL